MQSDKGQGEGKKQAGRWSREEHQRFMLGLMQHGKNWKKVEDVVGTRSGSQVRSHAQKFFNKLQKKTSDPKEKKQHQHHSRQNDINFEDFHQEQVSLNDNTDLLRSLDQDNSLETPLQIISLIKKQSVDNRKVNLSSFKKSLQQNQQKQAKEICERKSLLGGEKSTFHLVGTGGQEGNGSSLPTINEEQAGFRLSSFKSMNNILSAYENLHQTDPQNHLEDESFLIGLTKKYKKYFSKGGQFEGLIDFGNPHEVAKAAELQQSVRKKSWTLAEGIQGDQHDLEDIKNRLKENKHEKSELSESGNQTIEKGKSVEGKGGSEETQKEVNKQAKEDVNVQNI